MLRGNLWTHRILRGWRENNQAERQEDGWPGTRDEVAEVASAEGKLKMDRQKRQGKMESRERLNGSMGDMWGWIDGRRQGEVGERWDSGVVSTASCRSDNKLQMEAVSSPFPSVYVCVCVWGGCVYTSECFMTFKGGKNEERQESASRSECVWEYRSWFVLHVVGKLNESRNSV